MSDEPPYDEMLPGDDPFAGADDDHTTEEKASVHEREVEKVDDSIIEMALEDFQRMVKGNGIDPKKITLRKFDGEVVIFDAYERFKIESTIAEKHVPGKEQGEIAGSNPDAHQKIKAAIEKISRDPDVKKMTVNMLKKRPDLGYGHDDQVIRMDKLNKRFVIHEPCAPCDATGKILCRNCQGKKMILCPKCHGERLIQCHVCHGAQMINTPDGDQIQCNQCQGRGKIGCDQCRQAGEMTCPKCKALGKMPCQNCANTGWNSHLFLVGIKAKGMFDFDRETMPEELAMLIEEYREDLLFDEHADVRIVEDHQRNVELDKATNTDEFVIPYEAKLPWGNIEFTVADKKVQANLFGYTPTLVNMIPVIEKLIGRGLKSLSRASAGEGDTAKLVSEAIRYRAIAETFMTALSLPAPRALQQMEEKYPYGIEHDTLKSMIIMAKKSVSFLTKKPRQIGLGIGSIIAAALTSLYLIGPFKNILAPIYLTVPEPAFDTLAIILCGLIVTASIQIKASGALNQALGKLTQRSVNQSKLKPKISEAAIWGFPAAAGIFVGLAFLCVLTGLGGPGWLILALN